MDSDGEEKEHPFIAHPEQAGVGYGKPLRKEVQSWRGGTTVSLPAGLISGKTPFPGVWSPVYAIPTAVTIQNICGIGSYFSGS